MRIKRRFIPLKSKFHFGSVSCWCGCRFYRLMNVGSFGKEPTTYRGSCCVGSFAFLGKGCQRVIMLHWQKFMAYFMTKKCNDIFVVYIFAKYGYKTRYNSGRDVKSSLFLCFYRPLTMPSAGFFMQERKCL